jgi:hypothetical protein
VRLGRPASGPGTCLAVFKGSSRVIERDGDIDKDITVEIYGAQGEAGDVVRHIMIVVDDRDAVDLRGSDHARQFGRALIALADEVEQMNGYGVGDRS